MALECSPGLDWQVLSQRMRGGGSHAVKRIYYRERRGPLPPGAAAVGHFALCVCRTAAAQSSEERLQSLI